MVIDGLRVHYEQVGRGPDVLLIHGWASSWRMWARSMSRLAAAGYRATAIDLIGFGESDKPEDGWYTLGNFTRYVRSFAAQLGLTQPAIVGHSMGGTLALSLALEIDPSALVVAAPVVTGELGLSVHLLLTSPAARRLFGWMRQQGFFSAIGARRMPAAPGLMRDPVRRRNQEDLQKTTVNAVIGSLRTVVGSNLQDQLSLIDAPTLVIVGGRDLTVSPAQGRRAAKRIPGARLIEWPDVGHSIVDDRGDDCDELSREHLGSSSAAAGRAAAYAWSSAA